MTEVARRGALNDHKVGSDRVETAGEIIEERRKDSEGRIGVYKYLKGKMLGKVRIGDFFLMSVLNTSVNVYSLRKILL